MPRFDPDKLSAWTQGRWNRQPEADLCGWAFDSRKIEPGQVFVALKTDQRDGHDFVAAAAERGAVAALVAVEQAGAALPQLTVADPLQALQTIAREHRREFPGRVVGITGSAGKTSTKNLLALMLGQRSLATPGNLNNQLGVPLTLTMLDPVAHDFGIIEAGISGPSEMDELAAMIEPDAAIVTLVDHAHTAGLGNLAGVAREKVKLARAVTALGEKVMPLGVAGLEPFQALAETRVVVERVEVFGRRVADHAAQFMVTHQREHTVLGFVRGDRLPETYLLARTTDGMAQNAALAITLARGWGRTAEEVQMGLAQWRPAALRGEVRRDGERLVYLDCYNANPAAMRDAVAAFERMTTDEAARLFIIGGMEELGTESWQLHEEVGRELPLRADDRLALIGSDAAAVKAGAMAAGVAEDRIQVVADLVGLASIYTDWKGPVFIKGSRRYALETLLAEEAALNS